MAFLNPLPQPYLGEVGSEARTSMSTPYIGFTVFRWHAPRYHGRMVIMDACSLDYEILNRVAELDTGEWLFVSYKATKRKNVPVFLKAPNNEEVLRGHLKRLSSTPRP